MTVDRSLSLGVDGALSLIDNLCLWWLVLSLSLSLSLSWFGVDHGNGLQVNLKCKQFYTLGLPILRLKILIFGLTKFSVQTHH